MPGRLSNIGGPVLSIGHVCRCPIVREVRIIMADRSNHEQATLTKAFSAGANYVASAAGKPISFSIAFLVVLVWALTGPIFHYSDTWQLVINTGTTIVTFLMVFLIQNSQNRDGAAIQVKLDELIRSSAAQNSFVGIEHLTEEEIAQVRTMCEARAKANIVVERIDDKAEAAADRS